MMVFDLLQVISLFAYLLTAFQSVKIAIEFKIELQYK